MKYLEDYLKDLVITVDYTLNENETDDIETEYIDIAEHTTDDCYFNEWIADNMQDYSDMDEDDIEAMTDRLNAATDEGAEFEILCERYKEIATAAIATCYDQFGWFSKQIYNVNITFEYKDCIADYFSEEDGLLTIRL